MPTIAPEHNCAFDVQQNPRCSQAAPVCSEQSRKAENESRTLASGQQALWLQKAVNVSEASGPAQSVAWQQVETQNQQHMPVSDQPSALQARRRSGDIVLLERILKVSARIF